MKNHLRCKKGEKSRNLVCHTILISFEGKITGDLYFPMFVLHALYYGPVASYYLIKYICIRISLPTKLTLD